MPKDVQAKVAAKQKDILDGKVYTLGTKGDSKSRKLADQTFRRASCCQPVPGERIVGITYRGAGVVIHAIDCGPLVEWRHLANHVGDLPPRVLVRTYQHMPQRQWDGTLSAFAPDTVALLADRGVVLVDVAVMVPCLSGWSGRCPHQDLKEGTRQDSGWVPTPFFRMKTLSLSPPPVRISGHLRSG